MVHARTHTPTVHRVREYTCNHFKMERTEITFLPENDSFIFPCPHCGFLIQVLRNETACCIFRHAVYRRDGSQFPPHASEELCETAVSDELVYGCAKPFKLVLNPHDSDTPGFVEICEYI